MLIKQATVAMLLACAAIVFAVPNEALAQEEQADSVEVPVTDPMTEQTANPATFESLIIAMDSIDARVLQLGTLTELTPENVVVVDVQDLLQEDNTADLDSALTRNEAQILVLRDAVTGHATLIGVLTDSEVAVEDVVALDVVDGSQVVVFYRPQQ